MPNVIIVIAPKIFRDEEYAEPKRVLESSGATVVTASAQPGECIGKLGLTATATISVAEALDTTWDAVVFVGGGGAEIFFDDKDAHDLAARAIENGSALGAICIAPSTLAHAGLLQGRTATAFPSQRQDLIAHGAVWSEGPVETDGRVVTANGPEAATRFGEELVRLMSDNTATE
jgi:protease I